MCVCVWACVWVSERHKSSGLIQWVTVCIWQMCKIVHLCMKEIHPSESNIHVCDLNTHLSNLIPSLKQERGLPESFYCPQLPFIGLLHQVMSHSPNEVIPSIRSCRLTPEATHCPTYLSNSWDIAHPADCPLNARRHPHSCVLCALVRD